MTAITHPYDASDNRSAWSLGWVGFKRFLRPFSLWFSVFLIVFPPLALIQSLIVSHVFIVSIPLILMLVCGVFGTRVFLHLHKGGRRDH